MLIVEAEVDIFLITEAEYTLQYLANPTSGTDGCAINNAAGMQSVMSCMCMLIVEAEVDILLITAAQSA
jgi:hypothetical protein